MPRYNTRWCSQCEIDWPALQNYNLCPKCGRCTAAETSATNPDQTAAATLRAKYLAFERYLREREHAEDANLDALEAALAMTLTISDPPGCDDLPPRPDA
jgi:hypothetical protein